MTPSMAIARERGSELTAHGNHFSCSMSAVLLARVQAHGGQDAVDEVLALAGSPHTAEYLCDIINWIPYDEAVALWQAGAQVTHHPEFARAVGTDAARRLNGSPIAALLRSLGSPERVYGEIATTATKYSLATRLETADVGPGFAEIIATACEGFPRSADHCAWTRGLLTQPTILFGMPPAEVEHEECAALGAPQCRYRVTWVPQASAVSAESERNGALAGQLEAMKERLLSMFATASDLIGTDDIAHVLARITDRAAVEIRAPSYLLAIRTTPDGPILSHHRGIDDEAAMAYAETMLSNHPAALPESWLVVPVRSSRRDYGRLLALYEEDRCFFAEERGLLEVYARYAASALDSASALMEAEQRYRQSSALLEPRPGPGRCRHQSARSPGGWPTRCPPSSTVTASGCASGMPRAARSSTAPPPGRAPAPSRPPTPSGRGRPAPGGPLQRMLDDPHAAPAVRRCPFWRSGAARAVLEVRRDRLAVRASGRPRPAAGPAHGLGRRAARAPGADPRPARPPLGRRRPGDDGAAERPPAGSDHPPGDYTTISPASPTACTSRPG